MIDEVAADAKADVTLGRTKQKIREMDVSLMDGVYSNTENSENPRALYGEEEWWDDDKFWDLWAPHGVHLPNHIADALDYPWYAGGGSHNTANTGLLPLKTVKAGYEYIKGWVKGVGDETLDENDYPITAKRANKEINQVITPTKKKNAQTKLPGWKQLKADYKGSAPPGAGGS